MSCSRFNTGGLWRFWSCRREPAEAPKIERWFNGCREVLRSVVLVLTLADGQLEAGDIVEFHGQTMGTTYSVKIAQAQLTQETVGSIRARIEERLREINRQMSHYQPDSELSLFNRSPGTEPVRVSRELAEVVRFSLVLHQRSAGAFDPTLGPLVELWGFSAKGTVLEPPAPESIAAARAKTGAQHLRVTEQCELKKDIQGLELNLGGLAKGFAADELARLLRDQQLTNTLVRIGGELVASGHNAMGDPWSIGIASPLPESAEDDFEAVVRLSGKAVSTSGNYRQFFVDEKGRRYGHIIDPQTGMSVQHNLASVTVVADNCLTADGLATSLYVMGHERGLRWIETWTNAAALFIVTRPDGSLEQHQSAQFHRYRVSTNSSSPPPVQAR